MKALSKVCLLIVTLTSCAFLGQASLSSNDKANLAAGGTLLGVGIIKWIDHLAHTTYGRGVGRIPDKRGCGAGLRDDGVSCWRDAHIYGKGCCCIFGHCCRKCPSGYHDDGCTCRKTHVGIATHLHQRQYCRSNEERYGGLCYPKCKAGYTPVGCCICKQA